MFQLLLRFYSYCSRLSFYISFLYYIDLWKKESIINHIIRKTPLSTYILQDVNLLCITNNQYHNINSKCRERLKGNNLYYNISKRSNASICERVYTLCNKHKPKALFIMFENIDVVDIYMPYGKISTHTYDEILETATLYNGRYKDSNNNNINMILRFIYMFQLVKFYCLCNDIQLYWYAPSKTIHMLDKAYIETLSFTEKGVVVCINQKICSHDFKDISLEMIMQSFITNYNMYNENYI